MKVCEVCGKELRKYRKRFCSESCRRAWLRGKDNPMKIPEIKEKHRKSIKEAMNRPEVKAKISGENNPAKRPEVREKRREIAKKLWEDPEFREKRSGDNHPNKRPEVREKIREKVKKLWEDSEYRAKFIGENNPMKRPEVREKMRKSVKEAMGRPDVRKKLSEKAKKRWEDPEVRQNHPMKRPEVRAKFLGENNPTKRPEVRKKMSKALKGEKNPAWKGGISVEPYCSIFKMPLKERIREKYGRKCFLCGIKENGRRLCVHHIDYDKKHCTPDNLIPLCNSCNAKVNFGREFWQNYFSNSLILREGFL